MFNNGIKRLIFALILTVLAGAAIINAQETDASQFQQGEPIKNLNFQAAEIRSVIRFLADYGKVNVVVAPSVEGTVTISLSDVSWQQALEIIGRTYDLAIVYEKSGYIRILPAKDYRDELTSIRQHNKEQENLVGLETRILKINNSTAKSVVDAVKSLLSDRGKAAEDERTNSIVLQEVPDNIDKVIEYIHQLDQPPRQIKISAQLLEISSTNLTELGIDWSGHGASGDDVVDANGNPAREIEHSTSVSLDNVSDPAGTFQITTIQDSWDLTAKISALVDNGKGKIIAHPEIITIDNSEARIQMGQKVPIKQFDESGNTVTTFEEVGTLLRVTPHITAENRILMHLMPERSSYEYDANGVIINTNNAETNVVVDNGQTAVIGGLTTQDEVEGKTGIPILMDIPILGNLFSYTNKRVENRDLVIFVTPTIVEDFASINPDKR